MHRPIHGFLGGHYRDIVSVVYLLFIYPLLTDENHLSPDSPSFGWMALGLTVFGVLGIAANVLKLSTLDEDIDKGQLQKEVAAPAMRFLAGWIALPLMVTMPAFIWAGEEAAESWLGPSFVAIGLLCWVLVLRTGRGRRPKPMVRGRKPVANTLMVLYENFVYTFFLESLWVADPSFQVTVRSLFVTLLPMTGLFLLLFLPATVGFYVEEIVRRRGRAMALVTLWFRFAAFRYFPVFLWYLLSS